MHPYQVWIITTQGKRIEEHSFLCADDCEAVAKAGSLIAAGQTAEVRTKDRLVGVIDGQTSDGPGLRTSGDLKARPAI